MDQPSPLGPKCLNCDQPMRHMRTTAREGLSEMYSFECKPCKVGVSQSAIDEPPAI
jgi:hypothetical protein